MSVLKNQLRQLQKFLRRRGASPQDAEDLVQEAVVRLFAYTRKAGGTREVFFMHRLQGLSHAEIAEKLGVSKSAVEKHIASALTILTIERQRE